MFSLHWFRYDLRIKDNQSFFNSLCSNKNILIYIFDEEIIKSNTYSSFHHNFIIDSLNDLENDLLKKFNAPLNIYYGKSRKENLSSVELRYKVLRDLVLGRLRDLRRNGRPQNWRV